MLNRHAMGFTLIELLVVVAIIGIIAAVAVPNLMNAMHRGKQSATVANIRAIGTAVEKYAIDHDHYPTAANIGALRDMLEPIYTARLPLTDAWRQPLVYQPHPTPGVGYTIRSLGKDGVEEPSPPGGPTHSLDADIIFVDGQFAQWPAGAQE